jgi:transcriptional regulator with XRE-family HTH domain
MMGHELRKLRERAGLTHEQLSFMAGLSRPYVSQLERDLKSPTVDTLFRICDALEASAALGQLLQFVVFVKQSCDAPFNFASRIRRAVHSLRETLHARDQHLDWYFVFAHHLDTSA